MAKDFDLQLDLGKKKEPSSVDLGLKLDSAPSFREQAFPTMQKVQRATFNIRNSQAPQFQPGTTEAVRDIRQRTQDRPQTISQGEPEKISPIRRAVRALPGDSRFERSLERDVIEPIAKVGSFLFPSEQDYYADATEELGRGASTEDVIKRGQELMQKDGFITTTPDQVGGQMFSPLDSVAGSTGRVGAVATAGAGIKRSLRLLSKRFARETEPQVIQSTIEKALPWMQTDDVKAFSNLASKTDDARRIEGFLEETVKRGEERLFQQAPRQFSTSKLPTPGPDEQLAVFRRTGGDTQYIFDNVNEARQFFDGAVDDLEIGVVPRRAVTRVADDGTGARASVTTIPRNVADDVVRANRNIQQNILDEAEIARFVDQEVMPPNAPTPSTPEAVLGRTPSPFKNIRKREATFLRDKLRTAESISKRAAVATRQNVKEIQNDLVKLVSDLPLQERGKFISTIKNIQTPAQLQREFPRIEERVTTALQKVAETEQKRGLRRQVREVIKQKQLENTESLRKALKLPSLNDMTVDNLRTFARTLADFKPGDRFLSQRILETIDRTDLAGMKTYREVQAKLAKEAGVEIEDLQKVKVSWMDKFRYDTALSRQNPFYDVVVRKINGSLIEGNIRFAKFEDELDELLTAARKSKLQGVGQRVAPTDENIFKYIEAEDKTSLVDDLTREELQAANYLIDRYAEARDYLLKENVLNKYVEDYITHIRRSGLEAYRQDGLISAIKETFEQYRVDQASFNILNEKTGEVLPLEKFFAFAQKRTGGLKPTQNVGRASKAYFMAFERKRALDAIVPELQAYSQSVTPTIKTPKGLDYDPSIKTFLKTYINNKRGRPATVLFNPGSPPDVIMRTITATTRLIDLGLSIPNFVAANVGEQAASFIQQGTKQFATGVKRMNTDQGKKIIEKYRGFVGRSPWQEISDTSKNMPDKMMTMMLAGFHDASVRANKQGLLASLTKKEFDSGVISTERLAEIRNTLGRWRALDNSASIIGSTGEGKMLTQYKSWAVPILSSTLDNLTQFTSTASRAENPFRTQAGQELMRETLVVGTVALAIYSYVNEEDETFVGQVINKSMRDALSAIGALDPEMWVSTPRAWQYVQDIQEALRSLVLMEEYKTGEAAGTLKGDDALRRLVTPAPVRQFGNAVEGAAQAQENQDLDFDLDFELQDNIDFDLDLDLDL